MSTAPPHSPPRPIPWARRQITSRMGAHMPMTSYEGIRPMSTVDAPIICRVRISIFLRPILSPKWPKIMPPSGRATKPTAKVAKARMVPTPSENSGKKSLLNTSPATTPYRKKSYHSMTAPTREDKTTRRRLFRSRIIFPFPHQPSPSTRRAFSYMTLRRTSSLRSKRA